MRIMKLDYEIAFAKDRAIKIGDGAYASYFGFGVIGIRIIL